MIPHRFGVALAALLLLAAGLAPAEAAQVQPRTPLPKLPAELLTVPERATGRLVLKVADEYRARATDLGNVVSRTNLEVGNINAILQRYHLTARQAINHPVEMLEALQQNIATASGRSQPDFAGILRLEGPFESLEPAARALNRLDNVEWVLFETEPVIWNDSNGGPGTGDQRAAAAAPAPPGRDRGQPAAELFAAPPPIPADLLGGAGEPGEAGPMNQACCFGSSCFNIPPDVCVQAGGNPFPGLCDASGRCGACCLPSGPCDDAFLMSACLALGGTYGGDASSCPDACPTGACCLPNETCLDDQTQAQCNALLGGWLMNTACEDADCDIDCGTIAAGDCFTVTGNATAFCSDMDCCMLVCQIDPFCCDDNDGGWDAACAAEANLVCMARDPCLSYFNGSCFEPRTVYRFNERRTQQGCNNVVCCQTVCAMDPFCCAGTWDIQCVNRAMSLCDLSPPAGVTPDYEPYQGYLTAASWDGATFAAIAPYLPITGFPAPGALSNAGYNGTGWAFDIPGEPFTDQNGDGWRDPNEPFQDVGRDGVPGTFDEGEGNGVWDEPAGLHGIADQLVHANPTVDCTGLGNLTRGKTITVGVIDDAYWPDHEDLHTELERGQSMILIEEITRPDHGTGILSIINAKDNRMPGFSGGVTGIVPEAKTIFFPLDSLEQGARELTAWASAIAALGPGDVICAPYEKVRPLFNTNNSQDTHTMIQAATDKGITVVVAAGDRCQNLDDVQDLGDSGGFVVGACSPGTPFYRLPHSNYATNADNTRGNIVHVRAWGDNVACAGFGTLQPRGTLNRRYTAQFYPSGTHPAAAQVAGLFAGFQGFVKQFYGLNFRPSQLRAAVGLPGTPPPATRDTLNGGFNTVNPDVNCGQDIDPTGGPLWIGNYPDLPSSVAEFVMQGVVGFNDAPIVEDVVVVRGQNIVGNKFSIKGSEDNYLRFDAVFTRREDGPLSTFGLGGCDGGPGNGLVVPEIGRIKYLATGQITDMVVVARSDLPEVNTLIVETEMIYPNVFNLMFVEAYDWRRRKWTFFDLIQSPADAFRVQGNGDLVFASTADGPDQFVSAEDGRILIRLWALGFPNFSQIQGAGDNTFSENIDLVNVFISENFGEPLP